MSRAQTKVEAARTGWATHREQAPPDWVLALAEAVDASSQTAVAARIGRSPSLVSTVIAGTYPGDMTATEELVRGALMAATLTCPELGEIPTDRCRQWRERSRKFTNVNSLRVRMYRACNRCPRNRKDGKDEQT